MPRQHRVVIKTEIGPYSPYLDYVAFISDPYETNQDAILVAVLGQLDAGATEGTVTVPVTVAFELE